jgi:hypothetical protein
MPTSQEQQFFSELAASHSGPAIPEAKRVYFQTRLRNRIFDYILGLFVREQKNGLTKAVLARRVGKPPEMINRWLGMPSNLTLDTVSDLLLGICAEELTPKSEPILDRSPQMQINPIEDGPKTNPSPAPIGVDARLQGRPSSGNSREKPPPTSAEHKMFAEAA